MNINTISKLKNILKTKKPAEVMTMLAGNNNPMLNNLIKMSKKRDTKGVEQFARNLFESQGRNFDEEFNQFRQFFN